MSIYYPENFEKVPRVGREMPNGHICSVLDNMEEGFSMPSIAKLLSWSFIAWAGNHHLGLQMGEAFWCRSEETRKRKAVLLLQYWKRGRKISERRQGCQQLGASY